MAESEILATVDQKARLDGSVARFNAWAPSYDTDRVQRIFRPLHRSTLEWATSLVTRPRALLDVGCGTGALLLAAAGTLPATRLVGADPAEQMVRIAHRRLPADAVAVCAGADGLPFADGTFDLVVCTMSFNFWPRPEAALREVARVLSPGGVLVIADLFAVGWLRLVAPVVGAGNRPRGRTAMDRLLAGAGLRTVGWRAVARRGPVPILYAVAATLNST